MELAKELFFAAVMAVLFSLFISKLVSFAMSADSDGTSKVAGVATDTLCGGRVAAAATFWEEMTFGEGKLLRVVETVEEVVRKVDRFGPQPVVVGKVFEPSIHGEEAGLERAEVEDDPSEVGSGGAEELPEEAVKCDVEDNVSSWETRESLDVEVQFPAFDAAGAADVDVEREKEKETEEEEITDEDDWERIERSELEKDFIAATRYVKAMNEGSDVAAVEEDVKMKLYGLQKVATEGPCRESPPVAVKVTARAKWNAWQKLGIISPDIAMEKYINVLSKSIPNWSEEMSAEISKSDTIASRHQYCHSGTVSGHQAELVGVRETYVTPEVILQNRISEEKVN